MNDLRSRTIVMPGECIFSNSAVQLPSTDSGASPRPCGRARLVLSLDTRGRTAPNVCIQRHSFDLKLCLLACALSVKQVAQDGQYFIVTKRSVLELTIYLRSEELLQPVLAVTHLMKWHILWRIRLVLSWAVVGPLIDKAWCQIHALESMTARFTRVYHEEAA